jgi:hypothetical protein
MIEYAIINEKFWQKGKLIGIYNRDDYIFQIDERNELLSEDKIKITNIGNETTLYEIFPNTYVEVLVTNKRGNYATINIPKGYHEYPSRQLTTMNKLTIRNFSQMNTYYENSFINIPGFMIDSDSYKELKNELDTFDNTYYAEYMSEDNHILRIFGPKDNMSTIKLMIELAIDNEMKICNYKKDQANILEKLESVQKEVNKNRKFLVDKSLLGIIIGTKVY